MTGNYKEWHDSISVKFAGFEKRIVFLNSILTNITYIAYPVVLLIYRYFTKPDFQTMSKLVIVPAVSFGLLSVIRNKIDRPRPYEQWQIRQMITKQTRGCSFPSRHTFSMACISMVFMFISAPLGIVFVLMTFLLSAVRVIGGVHYPSDVIAGALTGFVSGALVFIL